MHPCPSSLETAPGARQPSNYELRNLENEVIKDPDGENHIMSSFLPS